MKFSEKLKQFFSLKLASQNSFSEDVIDDLCDLLIEGDFGAAQAYKIVEQLGSICKKEKIDNVPEKLAELLEQILQKTLNEKEKLPNINSIINNNKNKKLTIILLLGVNGVGKTTTAAKLASLYMNQFNKKTILAAADTFRAAAIDQLKIHGERLGTRVIAHKQGGDPAAVVYDALDAALSSGAADVVIVDTAGRMHTRSALVEELRKIDRVVDQKAGILMETGDACYLKYLVLDATTGRNALVQAEIFHEAVKLDGIILTKYDSSAKGGVVFSLCSQLNLNIAYICTGEKYQDIEIFDPHKFVWEFTGIA